MGSGCCLRGQRAWVRLVQNGHRGLCRVRFPDRGSHPLRACCGPVIMCNGGIYSGPNSKPHSYRRASHAREKHIIAELNERGVDPKEAERTLAQISACLKTLEDQWLAIWKKGNQA
jgi:hypothetical protein